MKSKFISLFLAFIIGIMSFGVVFADMAEESSVVGGGGAGGNVYDSIGSDLNGDLGPIQTPVQSVLGVIQLIGFIVAIVMVMYVGIKYLAAGAGQKAEVKSTMVPMLVGAAMVGLAPTLVKWIFGIFAA